MRADKIDRILEKDARYPAEAYEFMFDALQFTQLRRQREQRQRDEEPRHVAARELVEGARDYALEEFGMLAPVVFQQWNVTQTDDLGEIIYNLIDAGEMSQSPDDKREDFNGLFDWPASLKEGFVFTHAED